MRRIVPLFAIVFTAACASEKVIAPTAQPQKSALLRCDQQREQCEKPLLFVDGKRMEWMSDVDLVPGDIESDSPVVPRKASDGMPHNGPWTRGKSTNRTSMRGTDCASRAPAVRNW